MKFISISKTYCDSSIDIKVEVRGVVFDKYDEEKKGQLLERVLKDFSSKDLLSLIKSLKTVFIDVDKCLLKVDLKKATNRSLLSFEDGDLNFYKNTLRRSSNDDFVVNYTKDSGVLIKASNYDCQLEKKDELSVLNSFLKRELDTIQSIQNMEVVICDIKGMMLNSIYQLFYKEIPDFSLVENRKKASLMLILLEKYGIGLGDEFCFQKYSSSSYPISLDLKTLMNKLEPLGELTTYKKVFFTSEIEKTITGIGEEVMEYIKQFDEPLYMLEKIVIVYYNTEHYLSSNLSIEDISKELNYSLEDTRSSMKLLRKIDRFNRSSF